MPTNQPEHHSGFSQNLNRRLLSYATAAAAGTGLLGLAQAARAEIVFTPAHVVVGTNGSYALDLNHDGSNDFVIHDTVVPTSSTIFNTIEAAPAPGNGVVANVIFGQDLALALNKSVQIGSSQAFVKQSAIVVEDISSPGAGQQRGHWVNVSNHYLGLKFQVAGETHYGWARLSVNVSGINKVQAAITGYAYETTPNTPILAGATSGAGNIRGTSASASAAGPNARVGSLSVLALGAPGLPIWRRSESAGDFNAS